MKKFFISSLAVASMLFAASCSNEADMVSSVDETTVSFKVATPEIATRAYGDGETVNKLQYAVYNTSKIEDKLIEGTKTITAGQAIVNLQLSTNNTYRVIFWAAAPNAPYTVDYTAKTITVDYTNAKSNDENRDAFYAYQEIHVTNNMQAQNVDLKRPFAQLNIGTSDYEASATAGYTPTQSYVKVKGIYNTLNFDGTVTGELETEYTFDYADIKRDETFPVTGYEYLAMNYLLVGTDNSLVDIEFGHKNETDKDTRVISSVPVQRNYRTNIYGALLTNSFDVNVDINPDFDGSLEAKKLFHAAAFGGTVTLEEDVVLTSPLNVQANMTINLNGKTITTGLEEEGRHHYAILNNASLNIEGDGAINARGVKNFGTMTVNGNVTITNVDTNGGAAIWNEGKLTINNGTFTTNTAAGEGSYGAALNTRANGEAVVNGGNFIAYSQLTYAIVNEGQTVINDANVKGKHGAVGGSSTAKTDIYGGTFELMENPNITDHCTFYCSNIYGGRFSLGNNTDNGAQLFYESKIAEGHYALQYETGMYTVQAIDAASKTITINSKDDLLKLTTLNNKWTEFFSNGQGTEYENYVTANGGKGTDFYYKWDWTIKLNADIDFGGEEFNSSVVSLEGFGYFDGQNHTIKNVTIKNTSEAGLFNADHCGLKNIVLDKVTVEGGNNGTAGILTSDCHKDIDNITITNSSVEGGKYTGGVVGYGYCDVTNCTLTSCSVKGNYKFGGVIGYICSENSEGIVNDNTLTDCTVEWTGNYTSGKSEYVIGKVVGNFNCNGACENNTINNMTTTATANIGKIEAGNTVTAGEILYAGSKTVFEEALTNSNIDVIELGENLTYNTNEAISIEKDLVINAEGKTITAGASSSLTPSVAVMGEYNVHINEANVVGGFIGAYYGANVTFDGGSLTYTDGKSGRNCFYAVSNTDNISIITIKDADVNMANASGNTYICAHGNAIVYVEGGNFYGKPVGSSHPYIKEATLGQYTGKVIISGGTFNFDPTDWLADGYQAVQSGSTWTVSKQ